MPATILVIVGFETLAQCHGDPLDYFFILWYDLMCQSVGVIPIHPITLTPYHTLNFSHTLFVFLKIFSFYLCNRTALV